MQNLIFKGKKNTNKVDEGFFFICVYLLIGLGVVLSGYQYFIDRSLWMDEAMLALNIVNKSYAELLQPLELKQVAPIGFLFAEKVLVNLFGASDWVFRIIPFLGYLGSLYLGFLVAAKITVSRKLALVITAMLATNYNLVYFASEVKQYSTDVFFCLLVLYHTLILLERKADRSSLLAYSMLGVSIIWFSNVVVILLFICGLYVLYVGFFKHKNNKVILPIILWGVSFVIYYTLFVHNHPTKAFMVKFWTDSNAFLSSNPFHISFYQFIIETVTQIIYTELIRASRLWGIYCLCSLIGILYLLYQKKYWIVYVLVAPLFLHLLLSSLHLYPFALRLVLYLIPLLTILLGIGFYACWEFVSTKIVPVPTSFLLVPVLLLCYTFLHNYPVYRYEIKQNIHLLEQNIEQNDGIVVYNRSLPAFQFYTSKQPIFKIPWNSDSQTTYLIENFQSKIPAFNNHKVICLRGGRGLDITNEISKMPQRVWLIFSNVYPYEEENKIIKQLQRQGYKSIYENKCINTYQKVGSSLYLLQKDAN